MRHGQLDCGRKVDDRLPVSCRLPDIQYGVADLKSVLRLGAGKGLRTVLETVLLSCLFCQLFQKRCSLYCDLQDLFFGLLEHLLSLSQRS